MYAIRSYYGTVLETLQIYRMQTAKFLLLTNDYRISEIAQITGYQDAGYFGKNRITSYNVCYTKLLRLTEYNQEEFHLEHARVVEETMKYFADKLGYKEEVEFWGNVGLLHDLDFEQYPNEHCIKSQEIMKEKGLDERLIHATASHGYGLTVDVEPVHEMEKVLFAVDELTGLIGASVLSYNFV